MSLKISCGDMFKTCGMPSRMSSAMPPVACLWGRRTLGMFLGEMPMHISWGNVFKRPSHQAATRLRFCPAARKAPHQDEGLVRHLDKRLRPTNANPDQGSPFHFAPSFVIDVVEFSRC